MKKFKFNFDFLNRFKKSKKIESEDSIDQPIDTSEFELDESPEDYAEKTLGGFNANNINLNSQAADVEQEQDQEYAEDIQDNEDEQSHFTEMPINRELPVRKFKFPKFNHQETANRIKSALKRKSTINSFEKISWNDFVIRIFSPYTRGKVHSSFIVFTVIVITYMLGKNIALLINKTNTSEKMTKSSIPIPLEKNNTSLQDISKIAATNIFNAKISDKIDKTVAKKDFESIVCLDATNPTALQIKLIDTIVLQDSIKSVASVQMRDSSELLNVREGERIGEMAEISKIDRMKLILKNLQSGECEYAASESEEIAEMPQLKIYSPSAGKSLFKSTNPNIKNTGNSFKIKRSFRDSMVNNMSDVLSQAKAVQITNPDGSLCFKMTEVVAGSIYSQLDIQENDIICNINGKKIENLNELMGLLGKIKEIDQFQIGLKRNGMSEDKEYGFE